MLEKHFSTSVRPKGLHYDALTDKHASFYFNAHGLRKHLKKLKKAISSEPPSRHLHQYSQMLQRKITELADHQDTIPGKIQPYQQSLKPASLYKLQRMQQSLEDKAKDTCAKRRTESWKPLTDNSLQALPHVAKRIDSIHKTNQQIESSTLKNTSYENVHRKSLSTLKNNFKGNPTNAFQRSHMALDRERSNLSLAGGKKAQSELKQVQHQQFMLFLRKRQENLKKKGVASRVPETEIREATSESPGDS